MLVTAPVRVFFRFLTLQVPFSVVVSFFLSVSR